MDQVKHPTPIPDHGGALRFILSYGITGGSFIVPLLEDLLQGMQAGAACSKIDVVWAIRSVGKPSPLRIPSATLNAHLWDSLHQSCLETAGMKNHWHGLKTSSATPSAGHLQVQSPYRFM